MFVFICKKRKEPKGGGGACAPPFLSFFKKKQLYVKAVLTAPVTSVKLDDCLREGGYIAPP